MSESRRALRATLQRIMDAGSGCGWLEPAAKLVFGALLVAGLLFATILALR